MNVHDKKNQLIPEHDMIQHQSNIHICNSFLQYFVKITVGFMLSILLIGSLDTFTYDFLLFFLSHDMKKYPTFFVTFNNLFQTSMGNAQLFKDSDWNTLQNAISDMLQQPNFTGRCTTGISTLLFIREKWNKHWKHVLILIIDLPCKASLFHQTSDHIKNDVARERLACELKIREINEINRGKKWDS